MARRVAKDVDLPKAAAVAAVAGAAVAGGKVARDRARAQGEPRHYRLDHGETIPDGVRRIARGRIDHAIDELRGKTDSTPDKAVHGARKDMKKLRALLRLVRSELGDEVYRRENETFRDAARSLSGVRDADVMIATLEDLAERDPEGVPSGVREALRQALTAHRDSLGAGGGSAAEEAVATLREARERVEEWPLERQGFRALSPGLQRNYRRGRRAYRAAAEDPTVDGLHEWRKHVKDLWYHLTIVGEAWPAPLDATGEEAHVLSEHLGVDHDLAVLLDFALERPDAFGGSEQLAGFVAAVESRRIELQDEAFALGRRLFAERTGAFSERVGAYWKAWRRTAAPTAS